MMYISTEFEQQQSNFVTVHKPSGPTTITVYDGLQAKGGKGNSNSSNYKVLRSSDCNIALEAHQIPVQPLS